jgi:hypothetical protein
MLPSVTLTSRAPVSSSSVAMPRQRQGTLGGTREPVPAFRECDGRTLSRRSAGQRPGEGQASASRTASATVGASSPVFSAVRRDCPAPDPAREASMRPAIRVILSNASRKPRHLGPLVGPHPPRLGRLFGRANLRQPAGYATIQKPRSRRHPRRPAARPHAVVPVLQRLRPPSEDGSAGARGRPCEDMPLQRLVDRAICSKCGQRSVSVTVPPDLGERGG